MQQRRKQSFDNPMPALLKKYGEKKVPKKRGTIVSLTPLLAICLGTLLTGWPTYALTGNDWNGLGDDYRKGLVHGILDGWLEAAMRDDSDGLSGEENTLLMTCFLPKGMSYAQVYAIVDKHLKNNPEIWNRPLPTIIFDKILSLCPREH